MLLKLQIQIQINSDVIFVSCAIILLFWHFANKTTWFEGSKNRNSVKLPEVTVSSKPVFCVGLITKSQRGCYSFIFNNET